MVRATSAGLALLVAGLLVGCDGVRSGHSSCPLGGPHVTANHDTPIATRAADGHLTEYLEFNRGVWAEDPPVHPAGRPTRVHGRVRLTGRDTAVFVPDHGTAIALRHHTGGCA